LSVGEVRYRPARLEDNHALHEVFLTTVAEIDRRTGSADAVDDSDPAVRAASWVRWQPLFDHLANTADLSWLAEDGSGEVVGYARSINRDGVRELTEFFVLPAWQGKGVGAELLRRAFPADGADHRSIIATLELGALGRYLKTGLSIQSVVMYVSAATPKRNAVDTDLVATPIRVDAGDLAELNRIDATLLGHTREVDHRWLLDNVGRDGFIFRRGDRVAAYGYVGDRSGPVATLEPGDTEAVLAYLETHAAEQNHRDVGFWLPSANREAVAYLLGRGFKIDPFLVAFFSDHAGVALDRYLITSPPFFI
jgi:GNAT superfamily N-acetyltransferase